MCGRDCITKFSITQTVYACAVFHIEEVSLNDTTKRISPIEGEIAELNIPREVLESAERDTSIRMASFLFRNMSGLLPESLDDGTENDTYVSLADKT